MKNAQAFSNTKLKVYYVNARSLRNKFTDLEEIAYSDNYDIIGITETWLNTDVRDYLAEYKIPGYTMFEKSRVTKNGGGIIFYIKTKLNPVVLSKPLIANVDALFIILKNKYGAKLALSLVYRPPAQSVQTDNDLYEQISEISDAYDAVVMGDFNLPMKKWGEPLTSHHGHDLYSNFKDSSLTQFVNS